MPLALKQLQNILKDKQNKELDLTKKIIYQRRESKNFRETTIKGLYQLFMSKLRKNNTNINWILSRFSKESNN